MVSHTLPLLASGMCKNCTTHSFHKGTYALDYFLPLLYRGLSHSHTLRIFVMSHSPNSSYVSKPSPSQIPYNGTFALYAVSEKKSPYKIRFLGIGTLKPSENKYPWNKLLRSVNNARLFKDNLLVSWMRGNEYDLSILNKNLSHDRAVLMMESLRDHLNGLPGHLGHHVFDGLPVKEDD